MENNTKTIYFRSDTIGEIIFGQQMANDMERSPAIVERIEKIEAEIQQKFAERAELIRVMRKADN